MLVHYFISYYLELRREGDGEKYRFETIALRGTHCVIFDIQAWSFTRVNSRRLQSQCLAITAFCKAP